MPSAPASSASDAAAPTLGSAARRAWRTVATWSMLTWSRMRERMRVLLFHDRRGLRRRGRRVVGAAELVQPHAGDVEESVHAAREADLRPLDVVPHHGHFEHRVTEAPRDDERFDVEAEPL